MPKSGEVLVRIAASGVNFIDTYFREGRYPAPLPFTPGQEAAGVVEAVGPDVTGFAVGDHVAWNGTRGTYAQYACAPAKDLLHVPAGMNLDDAAAVLLQGLTRTTSCMTPTACRAATQCSRTQVPGASACSSRRCSRCSARA